MARAEGRPLVGPPPTDVLPEMSAEQVARSIADALPNLLVDLEDDTRNVLLTLARMWFTVETGRFRAKDAAADWVIERLAADLRAPLVTARDLYRAGGWGDWGAERAAVRAAADELATRIRIAAGPPITEER